MTFDSLRQCVGHGQQPHNYYQHSFHPSFSCLFNIHQASVYREDAVRHFNQTQAGTWFLHNWAHLMNVPENYNDKPEQLAIHPLLLPRVKEVGLGSIVCKGPNPT